ncbi:MAG: hypothetical protein RLZZ469_1262 [Bacteroidota bacterium]|jgi:uncharacterized membrane protein (UPF0127 family)
MKKVLSIIVVVAMFITSGLIFWAGLAPESYARFWQNYLILNQVINSAEVIPTSEPVSSAKGELIIGKNTWNVEIASTEKQRVNGLSNRRALLKQSGMLFAFDTLDYHLFWMKDMLIPLDIIFLDENWKIVLLEKNLDAKTYPNTFGMSVKSKYVLEINANEAVSFGLKVGDQAIFLNK